MKETTCPKCAEKGEQVKVQLEKKENHTFSSGLTCELAFLGTCEKCKKDISLLFNCR